MNLESVLVELSRILGDRVDMQIKFGEISISCRNANSAVTASLYLSKVYTVYRLWIGEEVIHVAKSHESPAVVARKVLWEIEKRGLEIQQSRCKAETPGDPAACEQDQG